MKKLEEYQFDRAANFLLNEKKVIGDKIINLLNIAIDMYLNDILDTKILETIEKYNQLLSTEYTESP